MEKSDTTDNENESKTAQYLSVRSYLHTYSQTSILLIHDFVRTRFCLTSILFDFRRNRIRTFQIPYRGPSVLEFSNIY